MDKIAYIIPAFTESKNSRKGYNKIAKFLKEKGIKSKILNITWKNKVMSDYVSEAINQIDSTREFYLIGFSYGAFISFMMSTKINPKAQILLSLSPYFSEDLNKLKLRWKRYIGKRRVEDFKKIHFNKLAPLVKCNTFILFGEHEPTQIKNRVKEAGARIKRAKIIAVKGAKHNIDDKNYLAAIETLLNFLPKNLNTLHKQ